MLFPSFCITRFRIDFAQRAKCAVNNVFYLRFTEGKLLGNLGDSHIQRIAQMKDLADVKRLFRQIIPNLPYHVRLDCFFLDGAFKGFEVEAAYSLFNDVKRYGEIIIMFAYFFVETIKLLGSDIDNERLAVFNVSSAFFGDNCEKLRIYLLKMSEISAVSKHFAVIYANTCMFVCIYFIKMPFDSCSVNLLTLLL